MTLRWLLLVAAAWVCVAPSAHGQMPAPNVSGTWEVDTPDGPQNLVVRPDSSASFGDETVRWRLSGDTMYIAFGEEWVGYTYTLRGDTLTFSGGDLEEPISMVRIGPASPRPAGVPLPKPPAWKSESGG